MIAASTHPFADLGNIRNTPPDRLSAYAEQRGQDPEKIYIPMSRGEIADYLGLTTETVSRIIGRLSDHGVVDVTEFKYIEILDLDRPTDLAECEDSSSAF